MDVGVRVIRGPDWDHGNEDGGVGHVGTVINISHGKKSCTVQWDVGTVTECLCEGEKGTSDLRIVDNRQAGVFFYHWECNVCLNKPILGLKWKCCACDDFDLCMSCYMGDAHNLRHIFVRHNNISSACVACPSRKRTKKIKLYGIGPGAEIKLYNSGSHPKEGLNESAGTVIGMLDTGSTYASSAKVKWESGEEKVYKLGAGGSSELVLAKPHQLGFVYQDHLPIAGVNELKEATTCNDTDLTIPADSLINVGDRVRVDLNIDVFKDLNKEYGGWNEDMEQIQGEVGIVHSVENDRLTVFYQSCRRPWSIYRGACTKVSVAEEGDIIRVVSKLSLVRDMQMRQGGWRDELTSVTGKKGKVLEVDDTGTLFIHFPKEGKFFLNPSCCVKQYGEVLSSDDDDDDDDSENDQSAAKVDKDCEETDDTVDEDKDEAGATDENKGMVFDIGIRVVRGPNWQWGNQDDGEGHLGTVVDIGHADSKSECPHMCAVVQWDGGYRNTYRIGYDNQFDLKIYDTAALGNHHGKQCTECEDPEPEIFGFMWKCQQCQDVFLCSLCYHADRHDIMHKFSRFDYAEHEGEGVPKRQICSQIKLHGMLEGARVVRGSDWKWEDQDGGDGKEGEIIAIVNFCAESDRDAVEVTWDTGHSNVYRLGYKGEVDLKCTKAVCQGKYYRDHLPTFKLPGKTHAGAFQKEREKEDEENCSPEENENDGRLQKGDSVKIGVDIDILQQIQKEAGAWQESLVEGIGQVGTVANVDRQMVYVDFNGKKMPFHQMTLTKVQQFKKNQVVILNSNGEVVKRMQNGHGPWKDEFVEFLGKKGVIINIDSDGDVLVGFGKQQVKFNPDCLMPAQGDPDDFQDRKPEIQERDEIQTTGNREQHDSMNGSISLDCDVTQKDLSKTMLVRSKAENTANGLSNSFTSGSKQQQDDMMYDPSLMKKDFQKALDGGDAKKITQILKKDPRMTGEIINETTPLHFACESTTCGDDVIAALLKHGANVNAVNNSQNTPLLTAVSSNKAGAADLLLQYEADPDACNTHGQTAVHLAVQNQDIRTLRVLAKKGCDFNKKDQLNDSPLMDAITTGNTEVIDLVLHWDGIDLTFENDLGFSPIHVAARKNEKHALEGILRKAPDLLNRKKGDGFTPLHLSACMNHVEVAKILISKPRIDLEVTTANDQQTPLHLACLYGSKDTTKCLIESGASVNALDGHGNNALHLCLRGKPSIMMQKGTKTDGENDRESLEIAVLLIQHGINTETKNKENKSPLEMECSQTLRESLERKIQEMSSPSVRQKQRLDLCDFCSEEPGEYVMKPCGCRVCDYCGGKKCKKCPNCRKAVNDRLNTSIEQVMCQACSEVPPDYILQPCGCSICIDCGGKKCKKCPNCRKSVTSRNPV